MALAGWLRNMSESVCLNMPGLCTTEQTLLEVCLLPCNIVADCFQNWCTSGRGYSSQTFKQSRTSACVYEVCSSLLGWLCYARSARKYHSGFAAAANRQMSPAACALLSSGPILLALSNAVMNISRQGTGTHLAIQQFASCSKSVLIVSQKQSDSGC